MLPFPRKNIRRGMIFRLWPTHCQCPQGRFTVPRRTYAKAFPPSKRLARPLRIVRVLAGSNRKRTLQFLN